MSDCILWDGYVNRDGYGEVSSGPTGHQQKIGAHRLAYERVHGPVDSSSHVHHTCETKTCLNVDHLEVLTAADHCREHRPHLHSPASKRKDICGYGHNLTAGNARKASGACRLCQNRRQRAYKLRVRLMTSNAKGGISP